MSHISYSLVSWVWVECDPDAYLSLCEYLVLTTNIGIGGICPEFFKIANYRVCSSVRVQGGSEL